ncbi:MAG: rhomboid family intramembrane serine protease [Rhodobacteraceae bacterium]|nr:rhomboid family intramembrane serine protease [Paracoccaceae bacterium]
MSHKDNVTAINPLPPVVTALFLIVMGIEVAFFLGSKGLIGGPEAVGWRLEALQKYAFFGGIFDWMRETGSWPFEHLMRFVTYPFVQVSFSQALFVGVMLLAMGKMVAEVFGSVAMLLIFVFSAAGGALAYAVFLSTPIPLIGGFPAVYGLIGAFTFILWKSMSLVGANQARAFTLISVLMGIQLLFGLLFGLNNDWLADLGGFATGFMLSFVVAPGSLVRLRRD